MISGAIKDSGNKPVFVFSHFPAYNTVYGSVYGKGAVTEILKPFSKIVYISGHSHWPIADDKSIYQNKYTAFQTGTTSWTELEHSNSLVRVTCWYLAEAANLSVYNVLL
jgi:hypothetical protein